MPAPGDVGQHDAARLAADHVEFVTDEHRIEHGMRDQQRNPGLHQFAQLIAAQLRIWPAGDDDRIDQMAMQQRFPTGLGRPPRQQGPQPRQRFRFAAGEILLAEQHDFMSPMRKREASDRQRRVIDSEQAKLHFDLNRQTECLARRPTATQFLESRIEPMTDKGKK